MKLLPIIFGLILMLSPTESTSAAEATARIKVLIVTGGHGFDKKPFFKMFSDNAEIEFATAAHSKTNASGYEREDLLTYDVVVLYDMPQNITEPQKARFMSLFDNGTGLVVLHHALVSYQNWPAYEQIIGGRYQEPDPNKSGKVTEAVGWQHDVDVPVVILKPNHAVTKGVSDFMIHDEIYWGFRVGKDMMPLITTTHPKSGKPLAWTRSQGKSRVIYLQLGHGKTAFENENYRKLLAQGIRWAARREVPRVFLLDGKHLIATRQRIQAGDPSLMPALKALVQDAEATLRAKPVSVMDKKVTPPSGDKHDYMSMAPYFWPNPATTTGLPYIRRDGERNPEIREIPDHDNILGMPENVETLALAYYFTGEEKFAAKAAQFIRTWFLDPATRMNPHFQFAQAIRGVNTGRGIGLIESRGLVKVVDGVGLLAGAKAWTEADQRGLEQWFEEFLDWMLESKHGRDERAAKNNHGTYYDLQVASFGMFLGRWEFATNLLQSVTTNRIAAQIKPDGRQPLELARTKAWSYSMGNLSGLMSLARLGEHVGSDLWNYETPDGRSIRKAFDFLTPFALHEKPWPYQQLGGWSPAGFSSLSQRAATKLDQPTDLKLARAFGQTNVSARGYLLLPKTD
jgi:type 1 glutamine amidotransferase